MGIVRSEIKRIGQAVSRSNIRKKMGHGRKTHRARKRALRVEKP